MKHYLIFISVIFGLLVTIFGLLEQRSALHQDKLELQKNNAELSIELNKYQVTEQELIDLGATSEQAIDIIKASEVHNIHPKS